ncbi:TolC family protein [bacterium SCSIO 12643]|nr:TolC family protein [bacterium SCSIO 12643]
MMKWIYSLLFVWIWGSSVFAQEEVQILKYSDYLEIVKAHHPVAFQANLKETEGDMYLRKAKGGFDPKLQGGINQKYFDGKQYYSYLNGGLKVPTWYGIEAEVGYNNNEGTRLNPESYNVETGIWNLGMTVNLGKGLFIDQRRADLKQAKIIQNSTKLERKLILNQLVFDASLAYLEWAKAYEKVVLYQKSIENIEERYFNVKQNVMFGDQPQIDTLKVRIQIQDRSLKLTQSQMELTVKRNYLNTYLWQDGFVPLEMDSTVIPLVDIDAPDESFNWGADSLVENHPEVLMYKNNVSISKIDYRMKKESLKPLLQVKYNALSSDLGNGVINDYSIDNYKWGAVLSYPIFTRKERADVRLNQIKVESNEAKWVDKKAQVNYKIQGVYNQMVSLKQQVNIQEEAVDMYNTLLLSEQQLFGLGESSLFLINTRDQNLINAQLKLIDIDFQYRISEAGLRYQTMLNL